MPLIVMFVVTGAFVLFCGLPVLAMFGAIVYGIMSNM